MIRLTLCAIVAAVVLTGMAPQNAEITKKVAFKIQIAEQIIEQPIVIGLFGKENPLTTENFFQLCTKKDLEKDGRKLSFVGSKFHRIIPQFMIQGGDFTNHDGTGGWSIYGRKFNDENFNVDHDVGVLSMANAGPNTNGSQFFITTAPTPWLNGRHTVFGRVIEGMDTVYTIEKNGSSTGKPKQEVKIIDCVDLNTTVEDA